MINLQSKKLTLLELEKDKKYNYYDVIQRLKIPPEQRTIKDILRIKPFIEKSNLAKTFYDTFTDITFDKQGNVFNIKGFNDLLNKYPKLKTMPKHTVDMKEDYNLDLYEKYLNQAISQEKGECN